MNLREVFRTKLLNHVDIIFCYGNIISDLNKIICSARPTKSITWRKQKGAFKLDTTIKINKTNKYTFELESQSTNMLSKFKTFVNSIIQSQ